MRLFPRSRPRITRLAFAAVVAFSWVQSPNLLAQYGASPSQTGMFFNDLRSRVRQNEQRAGVRSGESIYDYSGGVYMGADVEQRPLGEEAAFASNEAVRQMGQPAVRSGYASASPRAAADYTQYSGPYPSSSTFFAPTYVSDPFLGGRRNLKVGPVNLGFGLAGTFEYNDNITRAGAGEEVIDDYIASVFLNVSANYQITQTNALSLVATVGVDHYFNHPEVAPYGNELALTVLPGSTIAFDMKVGPVNFVIYDRMSVRPAAQNDFALDPTEIFGVFQNDVGVAALWEVNSDTTLSVNFMRSDAISLEDDADIYDRVMHSVQSSLAWSPHGTWSTGIEGGYTWVHYPENYNNDGTLANAGVFFATPIGRSTYIRASVGVQDFSFDEPPDFSRTVTDDDISDTEAALASTNAQLASVTETLARTTDPVEATSLADQERRLSQQATDLSSLLARQQATKVNEDTEFASNNRDESDLTEPYYNVTLTNQLSARVSQTLAFGHESALNTTSNYVTADYVTYGVGIIAWRGSRLSLSTYWEDAEESGGLQKEDLNQWGFDAYLSHQLNSRLRLGLGYHYGDTDSDLVDRDYVQHAFNVDLSYALNRKSTVMVGYRYWTTDADQDVDDFDQNRIIMAVNYNFGP